MGSIHVRLNGRIMLNTLIANANSRVFGTVDERLAELSDHQTLALQLAPLFVVLVGFAFLPVVAVVVWSFMGYEGGRFVMILSLDSYTRALKRIGTVVTSARIALVSVVLTVSVGYPVAYFIYRFVEERNRTPVLLILVIPFVVNRLLKIFALVDILSTRGPLNALLFFTSPLDFLIFSEISVYIGVLNDTLPVAIVLIYLSLERIDTKLLEASYDLGGSSLHTFRKVTLPLSAPGVVAASILIFVIAIGDASIPELMAGMGVYTLGIEIASIFNAQQIPLAGAISVITLVVVGGLLYLGQRYANIMALFEEVGT